MLDLELKVDTQVLVTKMSTYDFVGTIAKISDAFAVVTRLDHKSVFYYVPRRMWAEVFKSLFDDSTSPE